MVHDRVSDSFVNCSMRGKFKLDYHLKRSKQYIIDILAVGDLVHYELNEDGSGVINTLEPRKSFLSRKAPKTKGSSFRGERLEQIIASNFDYFFAVCSVVNPPFNNKVLDRLLVTAESAGYKAFLVFNKIDLDSEDEYSYWEELYSSIGYEIFRTSTYTGSGISALKNIIRGKANLFWGHSGVGKSSLLNSLYPELSLRTGLISNFSNRGIHTTVTSHMFEVERGTFVIDTPGIREIEPFGLKKEDLSHFFPEFLPYISSCKYSTCTHAHEPSCAIYDAVENEEISEERYDSYLRLLATIEDDVNF